MIAATDYMKSVPDQIMPFVPRTFRTLGTDGFGRSDTREKLRDFFEVDRRWIVLATITALADEGTVERSRIGEVLKKYGINPAKPNPLTA